MSDGEYIGGPWNEGLSPEMKEEWQFIEDPISRVSETDGLLNEKIEGTERTEKTVQKANKALSAERKDEIDRATNPPANGVIDWSGNPG